MLTLNNVEVIYDGVILVLKGVSLSVGQGGITTLLGANGAGKSTTLKAISGLLRTERGDVTKGAVELRGTAIHRSDPDEVVKRGIVQVMEGRHVFEHLTVEENLLTGAYTRKNGHAAQEDLERVYRYFPRLTERREVRAGYVSGGEQQMVAIGRALMARPRLLLLDEPSLGLAPAVVDQMFETIRAIHAEGVAILLVEQNVARALEIADRAYVLEEGRIVTEGTPATLLGDARIQEAYLGLRADGPPGAG